MNSSRHFSLRPRLSTSALCFFLAALSASPASAAPEFATPYPSPIETQGSAPSPTPSPYSSGGSFEFSPMFPAYPAQTPTPVDPAHASSPTPTLPPSLFVEIPFPTLSPTASPEPTPPICCACEMPELDISELLNLTYELFTVTFASPMKSDGEFAMAGDSTEHFVGIMDTKAYCARLVKDLTQSQKSMQKYREEYDVEDQIYRHEYFKLLDIEVKVWFGKCERAAFEKKEREVKLLAEKRAAKAKLRNYYEKLVDSQQALWAKYECSRFFAMP